MHADFLNRLSPDVQALVRDVEGAAGIDIAVGLDPSRATRGPDGTGILACNIDEHSATLLYPSPEYFPDGAVVHEMLHVRRFLIAGVPRLSATFGHPQWTENVDDVLLDLDNALEHLVIVPEELRLRPERAAYWSAVMARTWQTDLPAMANADDRRRWALVHWTFLDHVLPSSPVVSTAKALLAHFDLVADAELFTAAALPKLGSKEDLVRTCFTHLQLKPDIAVFEYLDARRRTRWEQPL